MEHVTYVDNGGWLRNFLQTSKFVIKPFDKSIRYFSSDGTQYNWYPEKSIYEYFAKSSHYPIGILFEFAFKYDFITTNEKCKDGYVYYRELTTKEIELHKLLPNLLTSNNVKHKQYSGSRYFVIYKEKGSKYPSISIWQSNPESIVRKDKKSFKNCVKCGITRIACLLNELEEGLGNYMSNLTYLNFHTHIAKYPASLISIYHDMREDYRKCPSTCCSTPRPEPGPEPSVTEIIQVSHTNIILNFD